MCEQLVAQASRSEELCLECIVCGSRAQRPLFVARDRLHGLGGSFVYVRCASCGLGYMNPRPTADVIGHYYPEDYAPHQGYGGKAPKRSLWRSAIGRTRAIMMRLMPDPARGWLTILQTPPPPGASVLDVGCGSGHILEQMARSGWRTCGVDLSENAVAKARAKGLDVRQGTIPGTEFECESFDLILFFHVLEHLYDPRATLEEALRLLKPGGVVYIALPNLHSLTARIFGKRWRGVDAPRHLYLFTERTIRDLCQQVGFQVDRIYHKAQPRDALGSLGYLLRDLPGLGQLLGRLRDGKELYRNDTLTTLFYPPTWLACVLGLGDRIHVVCRKCV